jgi:kinetochore protein Spc7/SPC105
MSSDVDDGGLFTTSAQDQEDAELLSSPVVQDSRKAARRSSGIPPMNFNNPDDFSSSGVSGSEESGSEEEEGDDDMLSGDETGTAMSLDVDEVTMQSASDASTSSSARLELALQQAAKAAGTRGIEYDEYGDMSMEMAAEEVTNAFKPWVQQNAMEPIGSAALDQENVNPFSPAFKAEIASRPSTIAEEEEEEDDMSMDVTRAVGGILRAPQPASSPASDATMDFTQAVGKITSQKRRRSTTETGSPGATITTTQSKRRRSSVARSSMGDDTMDLTMAIGGIKSSSSPAKPEPRRRSLRNRRSSGMASEADDATMEFTRAVGGIRTAETAAEDSLVGNEELSMELTTVLGGINNTQQQPGKISRPTTPQKSQLDAQLTANTTPKSQERYRDAPDLGAKQLLTPLLQKQTAKSNEDQAFISKPKLASTPNAGLVSGSPVRSAASAAGTPRAKTPTSKSSPVKELSYPELPSAAKNSARARTPSQSPVRRTPTSGLRLQQDAGQQSTEQSPMAAKQQRSSPAKSAAATPDKRTSVEDLQALTNSIKLMSTPRKEALKAVTPRKEALKAMTPKKHTPAKGMTPVKTMTPRARPTPKGRQTVPDPTNIASPAKRLIEDLEKLREKGQPMQKIGLQDFLNTANIRFMDLTTTKRRMTTAPTPSKARRASNAQPEDADNEPTTLENAVVAAACTTPELELYQHACHELKRYTKEGKQMIAELEASTLREQPPLIQAYVHASSDRKAGLDVQMRDMKTFARLQSKELWYEWRSQLLDELMVGLQNIGEGLIKDDEILGRSEQIVDQVLPGLVEKHDALRQEAERLEENVNAVSDEEKEELKVARERLTDANADIAERKRLLESLQHQVRQQDVLAEQLQRTNAECTAAIQEANRVRESCRGVSLNEIAELKGECCHKWNAHKHTD